MFLAFKEIRREELRYGLIILMISLITFLIFMLSSLAIGLAGENTQALKSWQAKQVVLNKNANLSFSQSILTKKDLKKAKLGKKEAYIGLSPVVAKHRQRPSMSAQFVGIDKKQFIYQKQALIAGRRAKKATDVVADQAFALKGYRLGDKISLNGSKHKYTIVGFAANAKINIAPIVYGSLKTWKKIKVAMPNVKASSIISQNPAYRYNRQNAKTYPIKQVINKLPGYTAQNNTFEMMIAFLLIISLIVIAVFLYILTMQKMPNFAVMRAQGIPARTLVSATISQAIILVVIGIIAALVVMMIMTAVMPKTVPLAFTALIALVGSLGMLVMGIAGSLIPIHSILKVDPAKAIGE